MTDSAPKCSQCASNGRVIIDGYHGQNTLDIYKNYNLVANVAALQALNVNLSTCCTPALKASAGAILHQIANRPCSTSFVKLTNELEVTDCEDHTHTTSGGDLLDPGAALQKTFYDFLGDPYNHHQNKIALKGMTIVFEVMIHTPQTFHPTHCGFQAVVIGSVYDYCLPKSVPPLAQFKLMSNWFSLDQNDAPVVQISATGSAHPHVYGHSNLHAKTVAFSSEIPHQHNLLFVAGDTIVKLAEMPIFLIEPCFEPCFENTTTSPSFLMRLAQPLTLEVTENTLTSLIRCPPPPPCTTF